MNLRPRSRRDKESSQDQSQKKRKAFDLNFNRRGMLLIAHKEK